MIARVTAADLERHRPRLEAIAYGMLGTRAEAEDVVQDAWLRAAATDEEIHEPAAWLTTAVTRLAIDRLRLARTRREEYVGTWLPEPIVADPSADPGEVVAEAERLSLGFLGALGRLDPVERAVVLLREGFDLDYVEIAPVVDRTVVACRQIASRARTHAASPTTARGRAPGTEQALLRRLLAATVAGDLETVRSMLAEDVVSWTDSAGEVRAARRPVVGADNVARFLLGLAAKWGRDVLGIAVVNVNGDPGLVIESVDDDVTVMAVELDDDDRVRALRNVRAPDKLRRVPRPGRGRSPGPSTDEARDDRPPEREPRGRAGSDRSDP